MSIRSLAEAEFQQEVQSDHSAFNALNKFLFLSGLELGLAALWFFGLVPLAMASLVHVVILGLMAHVWSRAGRRGRLLIPVGFVTVVFTGPLGAGGVLLLVLLVSFSRQDRDQLGAWYERLRQSTYRDHETIRYQSIKGGRARSAHPSDTVNFKQVFRTGSAKDKQSVLAIIALNFMPDFYSVLQIALRDEEPTIRVQAAATFAKLRMKFKTRFLAALPQNTEATLLTGTIAERFETLRACIESGFLDRGERAQAHSAIKSMYIELPPNQNNPQIELALCEVLIVEQAYDEVIDRLAPLLESADPAVVTLYQKTLQLARRYDELAQLQSKELVSS